MDVNSLPKTVTRQRHGCNLNPGPSVPESSTLNTRLPSHLCLSYHGKLWAVHILYNARWVVERVEILSLGVIMGEGGTGVSVI